MLLVLVMVLMSHRMFFFSGRRGSTRFALGSGAGRSGKETGTGEGRAVCVGVWGGGDNHGKIDKHVMDGPLYMCVHVHININTLDDVRTEARILAAAASTCVPRRCVISIQTGARFIGNIR